MTPINEYTTVEAPILKFLESLGYDYIPPSAHPTLRAQENEVLFKPHVIAALKRINGIDDSVAKALFSEMAGLSDNQKWLHRLRSGRSRKLPGDDVSTTLRLVDFDTPSNNHFAVTHQLPIKAEVVSKPDIIVYLNGIPLVVIEAKSPLNPAENSFDAIHQIHRYELDAPRLFAPNLFNITTNGLTFLYGATGAPKAYFSRWRDPWPKQVEDFRDTTEAGLYALLEPKRLLDILAHFIVFETRDNITVKKICRYQQFRAVNKMVQRVIDGKEQAGLIWHTQGSGKSLTMAFAALKLKTHRGIHESRLKNPSLLVITDRVDLHDQITKTFIACGLSTPKAATGKKHLRALLNYDSKGQTLLSTIFRFHWEDERMSSKDDAVREAAIKGLEIPGSEGWILMVDECHRTQERDLGAYLRAILPKAMRFGFTGTPVKKGDFDTFDNFGAPGEGYLDKYGIDDAVADGATVPVYYQGRMTTWHLHDKELDVVFDQWFAEEPEEKVEELKRRGVTRGDLARFGPRIKLIATDIWAHYRAHVQANGFKAQVVAIDRLACVAYKEALDAVIAKTFTLDEGLGEEEALAKAKAMSACVYSGNNNDKTENPSLVPHQLDKEQTKGAIKNFNDPDHPLTFLIVCNKLLTGFDAPIEQVMYLDNPLTDHNLLQAIARTNRRYGDHKESGRIVDYIGVSKSLGEALSAYRKEDVASAMRNEDELADALAAAHRECMDIIRQVPRSEDPTADTHAALDHIKTEDRWYIFRAKATAFLKAYQALTPDPRALHYTGDLKFTSLVLARGKVRFENKDEVDWKGYSEKIRGMLVEHLEVTGLRTLCKFRALSDPDFWADFDNPGDIKATAVRKLGELKKITTERSATNPARYGSFSERVRELIRKFNAGLIEAEATLDETEAIAKGIRDEDRAHKSSGLSEEAYSIAKILSSFKPPAEAGPPPAKDGAGSGGGGDKKLSALAKAALAINDLYASEETAPPHWQEKPGLMKTLRQQVRRILKPLELEGWKKEIPIAVEQYAKKRYRRP